MQLKNTPCSSDISTHTDHSDKQNKLSIKSKLTMATCALLQAGAPAAQAESGEWDIDTALLYYTEDSRISVFEPVISAEKEIDENEFVKFKLVYDVLTGSTPYGAAPSPSAQTITNPSGNSTYSVAPGELPLNTTFKDTRVAFSGDWTIPLDRLKQITVGANFSTEYDFNSIGVSANYAQDSSDKNRTYTVGLGVSADTWDPVGGKNTELAYMIDPEGSTPQPKGGTDTKSNFDVIFGLTQVVNRSTIMQFNLGHSTSSGYLTDPYRYISIIGTDGLPLSGADLVNAGGADAFPYIYEKRPDSRARNTFFWRTAHHLTEDVINVSYRYFTDDWGINSHTLDFRYRYELGGSHYLQPRLRYYTQSEADFYTNSLTAAQASNVEFASADYRLRELVTTTLGLKYGVGIGKNSEFTVRAELMNQTYTVTDPNLDGNNLELAPDLDAVIIQFGYNFFW